MNEKHILVPEAFREIDFYGDLLLVALIGTEAYVALRPIVEYLGLDWSGQRQRLIRDEVLTRHIVSVVMKGADNRQRKMICIQLEYLPGWLFGILPSRIKPEFAQKLNSYREECFRMLWRAFQTELAFAPHEGADLQYAYSWLSNISRRVRFQCLRAKRVGLPATLTVEQWLLTLEHFEGKCAYCQKRPGVIIEHFVPLERGAGTEIGNCVPSCYACNSKKKGYSPDEIKIFPRDTIETIRTKLTHLSVI